MQSDITALMLCGGRSERLGGEDKGLLVVGDDTLATLTLARLRAQTGQQLISANRNLDQYRALGVSVLTDLRTDFVGPLAGIERGLQAATTDLLLVTPCDSPLLPLDLANRLYLALQSCDADIAIASDGEREQVLHALIKRDLLADLTAYLDAGHHAVYRWQKAHHTITVNFSDQSKAFLNVNTPAELDELQQSMESAGRPA